MEGMKMTRMTRSAWSGRPSWPAATIYACVVCVCVCVRGVCVCVRACVRACVCVHERGSSQRKGSTHTCHTHTHIHNLSLSQSHSTSLSTSQSLSTSLPLSHTHHTRASLTINSVHIDRLHR
jgi:hypothetical protein